MVWLPSWETLSYDIFRLCFLLPSPPPTPLRHSWSPSVQLSLHFSTSTLGRAHPRAFAVLRSPTSFLCASPGLTPTRASAQ